MRPVYAALSLAVAACGGGGASDLPPATAVASRARVDPAAPVRIASGDFHTCAVRGDGSVRCWGRNAEGQLGDGTAEMRSTPVTVVGVADVVELALGANSSCALRRDGRVLCWGAGKSWGDGQMRSNVPPTAVAGVADATQI